MSSPCVFADSGCSTLVDDATRNEHEATCPFAQAGYLSPEVVTRLNASMDELSEMNERLSAEAGADGVDGGDDVAARVDAAGDEAAEGDEEADLGDGVDDIPPFVRKPTIQAIALKWFRLKHAIATSRAAAALRSSMGALNDEFQRAVKKGRARTRSRSRSNDGALNALPAPLNVDDPAEPRPVFTEGQQTVLADHVVDAAGTSRAEPAEPLFDPVQARSHLEDDGDEKEDDTADENAENDDGDDDDAAELTDDDEETFREARSRVPPATDEWEVVDDEAKAQ